MRQDRTCKHCNQLFPNEEGKVFSNHVRWCQNNLSNGDKGSSKLSMKGRERFDKLLGPMKEFDVLCKRCQKKYTVREREKRHPEKLEYFCSRSCAYARGPRTDDFKEKVRLKLTIPKVETECKFCGKAFKVSKSKFETAKTCSRSCATKYRYRDSDTESLSHYRQLCAFRFSIQDFPEEFDFTLVEQYGWYAAKNRGNNLGGVSRDHTVSVRYGYENGVDPSIISHPANCQLMIHNKNVSKGSECGMTLEELKSKIRDWDIRHK
jgi:hypothetical protein